MKVIAMTVETNQTFWQQAGRILNSGQSRAVLLTGNIQDLFGCETADEAVDYVPVVDLLVQKWDVRDKILVVYELNGPIRFLSQEDREKVENAWLKWRTGLDANDIAIKKMLATGKVKADIETVRKSFETNLQQAVGKPTMAFEILRQMCLCSRSQVEGKPALQEDLIILIEGADLALPAGEITRLSEPDRRRVMICQDWFSDPGFMRAHDSVLLLSESRSLIHERIAQMPQVLEVSIQSPSVKDRRDFITWFEKQLPGNKKLKLWGSKKALAEFSAGLSIHALRQLLIGSSYAGKKISEEDVIGKVEAYIKSQLGEDIVEFKKPSHTLKDVIGFSQLKDFLRGELIPRFKSTGKDALPGAAVCGPIGGGKTFIFEAVAAELGMVVLVLKSIRSQWYGQTDVIFERLRRVLEALSKVLIFVDEADTQFGSVGKEAHATERRLTGKIQAMMSDPRLRGHVTWLLMTARIHLLSPDIRRPGRVGDLIIPILDPDGQDRLDFVNWVAKPVLGRNPNEAELKQLEEMMQGYFSASYAALRSELKAHAKGKALTLDRIKEIVNDHIPANIGPTRRYQILQALVNCTRRSLLPDPEVTDSERLAWTREIKQLEAMGVE